MSRVERVDMLLRQIEHETKVAFDEHGELLSQNARLKAENAKLREFATETWELLTCNEPVFVWKELQELACNLGIEVPDAGDA